MSRTRDKHRPLLSGILIRSAKKVAKALQEINFGTLTGLATRNSDDKKVLAATHAKICVDIYRTIVLVYC